MKSLIDGALYRGDQRALVLILAGLAVGAVMVSFAGFGRDYI